MLKPWIEINKDKMNFKYLCYKNCYSAVSLLSYNIDKIDWDIFSGNENEYAIKLLEQRIEEFGEESVNWSKISGNKNAIHLLDKYPHKIDWSMLSGNPCAIHLLETNQDKIDWSILSHNYKAMHILEKNQDKIDWNMFVFNDIFLSNEEIHARINIYKEELLQKALHPRRIAKLLDNNKKLCIEDIDDIV